VSGCQVKQLTKKRGRKQSINRSIKTVLSDTLWDIQRAYGLFSKLNHNAIEFLILRKKRRLIKKCCGSSKHDGSEQFTGAEMAND
jgi:hypothetical protein